MNQTYSNVLLFKNDEELKEENNKLLITLTGIIYGTINIQLDQIIEIVPVVTKPLEGIDNIILDSINIREFNGDVYKIKLNDKTMLLNKIFFDIHKRINNYFIKSLCYDVKIIVSRFNLLQRCDNKDIKPLLSSLCFDIIINNNIELEGNKINYIDIKNIKYHPKGDLGEHITIGMHNNSCIKIYHETNLKDIFIIMKLLKENRSIGGRKNRSQRKSQRKVHRKSQRKVQRKSQRKVQKKSQRKSQRKSQK